MNASALDRPNTQGHWSSPPRGGMKKDFLEGVVLMMVWCSKLQWVLVPGREDSNLAVGEELDHVTNGCDLGFIPNSSSSSEP